MLHSIMTLKNKKKLATIYCVNTFARIAQSSLHARVSSEEEHSLVFQECLYSKERSKTNEPRLLSKQIIIHRVAHAAFVNR